MSLVSVYGNIEIRGGTVTLESSNQFPAEPYLGMFAFVSGVLYVYNRLNGLLSWYPLTKKDQYYVHLQEVSAAIWDVPHGLGSENLIYMVYDSEDILQQAAIEIISASSARFTFETAFEGKAVLFVAEDNLEGIDTLRATIGDMYFEGKKIVIDGEDLVSKINSLIVWSEEVYTETEVDALIEGMSLTITEDTDRKVQAVYDTMTDNFASAELATTQEIDSKLSALSVTLSTDISNKVDKVAGMGLSTHDFSSAHRTKLDGIASYANYYVHPVSHSPSIIAQDSNNRFVTDIEKASWNARASTNLVTDSTNGLMSYADYVKLLGIEPEANKYIHPTTHPATMIVEDSSNRFVTDVQISTWDGKQDNLGYTPEDLANKGVANGYASLNAYGVIPTVQLPANVKEVEVVNDIAARDALTENYSGRRVHVLDATADTSVASGWAEYLWTGLAWTKTSEGESMDVVLRWENLVDKPTSTVAAIDQAVTDSHIHTNASVLDATTASFTTDDRSKLDGIALSANNYAHPATHPASMITTDSTHRFVTDTQISLWDSAAYVHPATHPATMITTDTTHRFATDTQIANWNAKASIAVATTSANGLMASTDKSKLDGIAASANNYVHPASHAISFITGLQTQLNYARGLNEGASEDPNTTTANVILSNHANSPNSSYYWHITTTFYSSFTGNRAQLAIQYNGGSQVYARSFYGTTWTSWLRCDNAGVAGSYLPISGGTLTGALTATSIASNGSFSTTAAQHTFTTPYGNIQIGPMNATWAHIFTDRANFYFNKPLYINGTAVSVDGHTHTAAQVFAAIVSQSNSDWYRTSGTSGWYSTTYGGGIHMSDATYVRVYNNRAFLVNNSCTATSFNVSSKRELKDNISHFTATALDIINALDIVNFTYKSDEDKRPHVGIIADDTDPIISGPDQDTFDVSNTAGILAKAVQELSEENRDLKSRLSSLEDRLAALEALLS